MFVSFQKMRRVIAAVMLISATAAVRAQAVEQFNLPEQPLAESLRAVGKQSNLNVLFDPPLVAKYRAPALSAKVSVDEALARILATTPFRHKFVDERTVVLFNERTAEGAQERSGAEAIRVAGEDIADAEPVQTNDAKPAKEELASKDKVQEIVVTAQKRKELLEDVPISISVLSGAQLDRSSLTSVTDALNQVPGVVASVAVQGGGTQMAIRGVAASGPRGNGASPVAYYLDSSPFGTGAIATAPDTNPYDLERIEILRGPQGTLYGASGQGGVVRILTHDADLNNFEFKSRARVSDTEDGGSNYGGDMALNVPLIQDKLAARLVVGYDDSSGWVDADYPTPYTPDPSLAGTRFRNDFNDTQLRNYRLKINAQPTEQLSIGLSAWSVRNDWGANSASPEDQTTHATMQEPITSDYDLYGLKIGYDFANVSVSSVTSYLDYRNTYLQDLWRFGFPDFLGVPDLGVFLDDEYETLSQEIQLNSTHSDVWRWTAGAFYREATYDGIFVTTPIDIFGAGTTYESEQMAAFGELTRLLVDGKLEATLGLRYFHDDVDQSCYFSAGLPTQFNCAASNNATFDATTPRAVLTWHFDDDAMVYGSYSEGFRSGIPQALDPIGLQFPDLQPDLLSNYEVGAKGSLWNNRLSFDAAIYYLDWRDVQQLVSIPLEVNGTTTCCAGGRVNSGSANGFGIDVGATLRPFDGLELGATFSWNDLILDEVIPGTVGYARGDRLNYSSEYTAGASASYSFPLGGDGFTGRFGLSANYSSEQLARLATGPTTADIIKGDDALVVRSNFTLDSGRSWTVMLFGDNLTNESGAATPSTSIPELTPRLRPRTIGLQFDYRFGK